MNSYQLHLICVRRGETYGRQRHDSHEPPSIPLVKRFFTCYSLLCGCCTFCCPALKSMFTFLSFGSLSCVRMRLLTFSAILFPLREHALSRRCPYARWCPSSRHTKSQALQWCQRPATSRYHTSVHKNTCWYCVCMHMYSFTYMCVSRQYGSARPESKERERERDAHTHTRARVHIQTYIFAHTRTAYLALIGGAVYFIFSIRTNAHCDIW